MTARTRLTVFAAVASYLATFAFWPLFQVSRWPYVALVVVAVMAVTGWLCRRLRVPGLLTPLVSAAVLLIMLTGLYTRTDALLLVLPTPASIASLGELFEESVADIARYAAPAPETPALMLLTMGGIGVVTGLVDLIAVRWRHPAVAGLPMLAIYAVSAAILADGPNWFVFLLGAVGFLGLLLADSRERLSRWGRPVWVHRPREHRSRAESQEAQRTTDTTSVGSLGRRIGVVAVGIAVVVPIFVPLSDRGIGGNGAGAGWWTNFGAPTLESPNPVVSMRRTLLRQSDSVFLRYHTNSKQPGYLRMVALPNFDGESWTANKLRGLDENRLTPDITLSLPTGTDISTTHTVRTRVDVRDDATLNFLPAPFAPQRVKSEGQWYYQPSTLSIFSTQGVQDPHYTVVSEVQRPRPTQLDAAYEPGTLAEPYLQLPDDLPAKVHKTAKRVTNGKETAYRKAVALQDWFADSGGFSYSTKPAGNGNNALLAFLHDRTGYCEQFASAMAVMARTLGIPAQVAVGFTQGTREGNEWVVRGRDAHAWPQLWFEGVGWIRFEPTPSGEAGQASAFEPGYSRPGALARQQGGGEELGSLGGVGGNVPTGPSQIDPRRRHRPPTAAPVAGGDGSTSGVQPNVWYGLIAAGALLLVLVLIPTLTRGLVRRRRWGRARGAPAAAAHAAWAEFADDAADRGLPPHANESPRATGARIGAKLPAGSSAVPALERIALAEERARYASRPDTPATLRADVRAVRTALDRRLTRWRRWRARLLPPSVFARLRASGRSASERYATARDRAGSRVRRLVPYSRARSPQG
ncbi:MAG: transglutaminase TgpA family protein [Streptosporangiales bacterium]